MADRGIALKAASGKTKSGRIVPSAGVSPDHAQIEMFEPKHVDGKTQLRCLGARSISSSTQRGDDRQVGQVGTETGQG